MAVTALVASLNPAIVARQNTGTDSAEVSFHVLHKHLALVPSNAIVGF